MRKSKYTKKIINKTNAVKPSKVKAPNISKISKVTTLKDRLNKVYSGKADLRTTCNGVCECCKTAMPQMNYCEFTQLINEIWETTSRDEKINMICTSIEYFMHNQFEKFGMQSLIKPCMLIRDNKCGYYDSRPLNCRIYGLWPSDSYEERVDRFEEAYEGILTREQLPLNKQCPYVKRVDDSIPITSELLDGLFAELDIIDSKMGEFTELQIKNKDNYRTLHDWLLWKVFGEDWLTKLTDFVLAADKNSIVDLVEQIKNSTRQQFSKDMPDLRS